MRIPGLTRHPDIVCRELVEVVSAYLEGTLPARERARFERHLAVCEDCTAYVEQLRVTIRLTGRIDPATLSDAMRERLLDAFRDWKRA